MSRKFTTVVELQSGIESACKTAVLEVAKIVCKKLQDLFDNITQINNNGNKKELKGKVAMNKSEEIKHEKN